MEFLAPLMLIGLAGAAVPVVIHLIGRRRAPVVRFGAMDFLLGQNKRVARRLRLRELLLLLVRVLAALAIPLALAKPFVSCSSRGVIVSRGPQAAVLVIDDSFVMGYRKGGRTLLGEAKDRALHVLEELGPEADVAVVFAAEGSPPVPELTRDHLRLADAIETAPLTARPPETTVALRRAAALLAGSPHAARRVYLFSALTKAGFGGEAPWPPGAGPELHAVPVTDDADLPNLAVTAAAAEKDPDLGPRGVRVRAEITNFGQAKVEDRAATLVIDGKPVSRGLVTLGPGEKMEKRFSAALPGEAKTAEVSVELDGDALAIDDRRYLRVELRRDVRVLLVDGDPRTVRHEDELFYLETALRPGDRSDSALSVSTTTVDELAKRHLADFDVVFLCNVPALEREVVAEIEGWARKGGGLIVTMGSNVDTDAYAATMGPILAQELKTPLQLAVGPKGPDSGRAERIGRFEASHPVFSVFSGKAAGLREASYWKIQLLGPTAQGDGRVALARFGNGAPALVERRLGSGRLLLYTSTIDREWNDLPIHPGFLPLVQQIVRYLARAPIEPPEAELVVGRARDLPVSPADTRIEVTAPSGKKSTLERQRLAGRQTVPFAGVDEPGFYHVAAESGDKVRPRPAADFVANLDPRGSDTRRIEPAELPAGGAGAVPGEAEARRRVELWHGLAAALLLVLLGEALLTRRG